MEPLSPRRRKLYFYGLIALFCILIPVIIFYASGYRFSASGEIRQTGGIHIDSSQPGATILLDGEPLDQTTFFEKGFFVSGLDPATYSVRVEKPGFLPWDKNIPVDAQYVSEAFALLVPENVLALPVPQDLPDRTPNSEYSDAEALFRRSALEYSGSVPGVPVSARVSDDVAIWSEGRNMVAVWTGDLDETPDAFCALSCKAAVLAAAAPEPISGFDFYPGRSDTVIFSTADGVFAVEIDQREPRPILPLYVGPAAGFRLDRGNLYIRTAADQFLKIVLQ